MARVDDDDVRDSRHRRSPDTENSRNPKITSDSRYSRRSEYDTNRHRERESRRGRDRSQSPMSHSHKRRRLSSEHMTDRGRHEYDNATSPRRRRGSRSVSPVVRASKPRSPDPSRRRYRRSRSRSRDRETRPHRSSRRSQSRERSHRRRSNPPQSPSPHRSRKPLPSQEQAYRGDDRPPIDEKGQVVEAPPKQKPNYKATGLLAAEANKVVVGHGQDSQAIVLKYHEPPEARKPPASEAWLMYIFKGASPDPLHTIQLHSRSCWLLGREVVVADIPVEHPSCSKQHAVLQFRYVVKKDEWGEKKGKVGLYILDLESANGTKLNGERIEAARYVELLTGDVVKFGESEREYVVLLPPKAS